MSRRSTQRPDQVVQLALDDDGRLPAAPVGEVWLLDELPRERERVIKLTAMLTQQPSFRVRLVAPQRVEARQALHLGQHHLAVHAAVPPALLPALAVRQLGERRARSWLDRLKQLPLIYIADGWSATHAGFNSDGQPDLSIRDPFWESYDGRYGRVVIGHTPRPTVERHQHIVLVDTGAVYGGLLSAYCPETDAVVQVQGSGDGCHFPRPEDLHRVPSVLAGDAIPC